MAASVTQESPGNYTVRTDLPPEMLSRVGLEIFRLWMDFAMGAGSLGGKRIVYPTGRYAAALQYRQEGASTVAIVADEKLAPEAAILETGHVAVDLKMKLMKGRAYPMHRTQGAPASTGLRRTGSTVRPGTRPQIWASARASEGNGFASIGPNSKPDSWIVPAMAAYSPAMVLSNMIESMARKAGG